jgi:hypothetical protein
MLALVLQGLRPSQALVIFAAPGRNLDPPTGKLADSGWQLQGFWGGFTGTPIGPYHFLTAKHVGGHIGEMLHFAGQDFRTVQRVRIEGCDLTVWRVDKRFPYWAPLYEGGDEVGQRFVAFGRGGVPYDPITGKGCRQGWRCGPADGKLSWGENQVDAITVSPNKGEPADLLMFRFDNASGPNECQVTAGDSGGGLFMQEEGQWKLAGILYGSVRTFRESDSRGRFTGPSFDAAVSDLRGMYIEQQKGTFTYVSLLAPEPQPSTSYATRVSSYQRRIRDAMEVPAAPFVIREWRWVAGSLLFAPALYFSLWLWRRRRQNA